MLRNEAGNAGSQPTDDATRLTQRFAAINVWVFDLDNTLYSVDSDLWPQIDERITLFLMQLFGCDGQSARALQLYYYLRDGTTLRGLMNEGVAAPEAYLEFVHDIDRSRLPAHPELLEAIRALPGRKLIFTSGSRAHARKTLAQLGIETLFDGIFDIVDAEYFPKPAQSAYEGFFADHNIDPRRAVMFEDLARNLVIPSKRGMATVLVIPKLGQRDLRQPDDSAFAANACIDFVTDDLPAFLRGLSASRADGFGETPEILAAAG